MTYFVVVSFELEDASAEQYDLIASGLKELGFQDLVTSSSGESARLPRTTFVGQFTGASAGKIRTDLSNSVKDLFQRVGFTSAIFLLVSGAGWSWGTKYTYFETEDPS